MLDPGPAAVSAAQHLVAAPMAAGQAIISGRVQVDYPTLEAAYQKLYAVYRDVKRVREHLEETMAGCEVATVGTGVVGLEAAVRRAKTYTRTSVRAQLVTLEDQVVAVLEGMKKVAASAGSADADAAAAMRAANASAGSSG